MTGARAPRTPVAFTLFEVLVAVAIIGVLVSIALPVLANARRAAALRVEEKRQNEAHFALRHYAMDHRQEFPYYATPGTLDAQLVLNGFRLGRGYWGQSISWAAYVAELGYETGLFLGPRPPDDSPPTRPRHAYHVYHMLTFTAFAEPNYFGDFADQDIDRHQPQRWSAISHPSRKGLLIRSASDETGRTGLPDVEQIVTFADGHTETRPIREFRPGVRLFYWNSAQSPVLTTRDGLQGRDL